MQQPPCTLPIWYCPPICDKQESLVIAKCPLWSEIAPSLEPLTWHIICWSKNPNLSNTFFFLSFHLLFSNFVFYPNSCQLLYYRWKHLWWLYPFKSSIYFPLVVELIPDFVAWHESPVYFSVSCLTIPGFRWLFFLHCFKKKKKFLAYSTVWFFIMSVLPFFPWSVNHIFLMCLFKPSSTHFWLETLCVSSFVVASRNLTQVWACMCMFHILPWISLMLSCEMLVEICLIVMNGMNGYRRSQCMWEPFFFFFSL